ncbi:cell division protein FtsN [Vibrio mangrovi]|uniref:Cell division protein FtsN n=1 Tax=Vibrio mangrovi TaxID=474394 RepID=A0A1Y6J2E0_9VIBR|nr:cell division protein FtsN [Vibrio mangrovi]MDW6002702.1 cell division protein FtsN [Vibrio mangrovi]SMS02862.1 Cell division protein FtsN [Vibrio mangrovi]
MANKDYVKRGSATKKTVRKPSKRRPWFSGTLAVVLVAVFGYGLYTLSMQPSPPANKALVPQKAEVKQPTSSNEKTLPPPPAEKWDYVDILPKREIEVTPKELKVSDVPYIMQCGAYKTMAQAEKRKLDIAFQGIKSKIRKKEDSSWYRVVIGPYKFKRDAERDRHKLQRAKIEPCAIWKERQ